MQPPAELRRTTRTTLFDLVAAVAEYCSEEETVATVTHWVASGSVRVAAPQEVVPGQGSGTSPRCARSRC